MAVSDVERQRKFRNIMYEAGFAQKQVWIKSGPERRVKMDLKSFSKRMQNLTSGWSEANLSQLLNLFIKITKAKKEVKRLKNK